MISFNISKYFNNSFVQVLTKQASNVAGNWIFKPVNGVLLAYLQNTFYAQNGTPVSLQDAGTGTFLADASPLPYIYFKFPFFYGSLQDAEAASKKQNLFLFAWIPENYSIKNENEANYRLDFTLFLFIPRQHTDLDPLTAYERENYLFQVFENLLFSLELQGLKIDSYQVFEFNKSAVFTDAVKKRPLLSKHTDAIQVQCSALVNKFAINC